MFIKCCKGVTFVSLSTLRATQKRKGAMDADKRSACTYVVLITPYACTEMPIILVCQFKCSQHCLEMKWWINLQLNVSINFIWPKYDPFNTWTKQERLSQKSGGAWKNFTPLNTKICGKSLKIGRYQLISNAFNF